MTVPAKADLHIHTTASDGSWTPEEAVRAAKRAGLRAIAIADHDTLDGVEPAQIVGKRAGVEVLTAVEINTDFKNTQFHILGYFFNAAGSKVNHTCQAIRDARVERANRMVEKLRALGIDISLEEVLRAAGEGSVGRPHVAQVLHEKGIVETAQEAFDRFILPGRPAFVERYRLTPAEAVRLIRSHGGVPVMAHPGLTSQDEEVVRLLDVGLLGIEVYHSDHTPAMSRHYEKFARKHNLLITGGSDSHGPETGRPIPLGEVCLDYTHVARLTEVGESLG